MTLAPERATPEQVARLCRAGVIVSAGHSDADYETVRATIDAGLTGFTHLFNAMSQLANRAPGMVGAALEDDATYAGVIVDGLHLHGGLVGFDLGDHVAGLDRVAFFLKPLGEVALLHRGRQGGHQDIDGHGVWDPDRELEFCLLHAPGKRIGVVRNMLS